MAALFLLLLLLQTQALMVSTAPLTPRTGGLTYPPPAHLRLPPRSLPALSLGQEQAQEQEWVVR